MWRENLRRTGLSDKETRARCLVFLDLCRDNVGTGQPKVAEDFPHVVHYFATLTSSNVFGFGGGKGHTILTGSAQWGKVEDMCYERLRAEACVN